MIGVYGKELAVVKTAKAYQVGEFLLVRISGDKPNGCHLLDIDQSPLDVEPPAFIATWFTAPNVRCTPDPVPYEHQEAFRIGGRRESVDLYHADGQTSVAVEDLNPEVEGWMASRVNARESVMPAVPHELGTEAIGYSKSFDFTEAFQDAISKIPTPNIPDWLARYTVLEIGAEIGGIFPFNHMFVRVRGG
jgi:hypothetical protein